jgi:hypothetical protein
MAQITVQEQINAIQKVTQEALKSKEAAHKFLIDAGIIKEDKTKGPINCSDNKKK